MTPSFSIGDLPTGPRGRMLALALTALVLLIVGFGLIGPALSWYADRAETLGQQEVLARRMAALAATRPELERQAAALSASSAAPDALLTGATDATAAASLQETMQALASKAGVQLASVEILPASQIGRFRRIGLRVALDAAMTNTIALLSGIEEARPRMLVDELDLQRRLVLERPTEPDLDARFVVYAFRAGSAADQAKP